ncbi:conserved hypothetical protein [Leishmania braziliensis MHOM/BR/75/M2904]|uniref:Uncharacterized protein n=2 Tax=Leishmania braziliensis TaxID=5660 RepID=A4HD97_LEIBR|nr:conserved hypothetical protein [Leishmania braziliensis MHOM/BR/75/M2904]KAI5688094.1 hypothetical protein MNV84_04129 [Leishmania braziliensis]CAJ2473533.1 unnamed protein product [Leishmania braziliensis]CAJ2474041.1 unnamed protein product [Leishmania braziliensis]CAM42216.1 conserved hypothetical protein [Leishmania braziliensis MHOM/BR/75/M2904]SYZ66207.1 hypothetical_protein [Leishmania braziliensis MHOM/BR/75/M2904]
MVPLSIYLNSDVGMERPYHISIPANVDTLAELCQYLTDRIPLRPGEDTTGRGYRFLYSVTGKPLWRVKECIEARTIVLSVGPGFLVRRPANFTVGPQAAAGSVVDITPDRPATQPGPEAGWGREGSPSASPPIKQPVDDRYSMRSGAGGRANGDTAYYPARNAPTSSHAASAATFPSGGVAVEQGSVDATWPPGPAVRQPSPTEERERLFSITLNTAMRGRGSSGGRPTSSQPPSMLNSLGVASSAAGSTAEARLFTSVPPRTAPVPARTSTAYCGTDGLGGSAACAQTDLPYEQYAATSSTSAARTPRGVVFVAHKAYPLPLRPAFEKTCSLASNLSVLPPQHQPLSPTSISSSLECLLLRKWAAYQRLHSTAPTDLVAGEAFSHLFNSLVPKSAATSSAPCRVLVSGPPRSGVSTTASFLLRHYLRTLQFQPNYPFNNSVLLVLDFHWLLGSETAAALQPPRLLLDLSALYQLIVRTVIDAVVALRPALREAGLLLAQLWDLVIKPNVQPPAPPNFTTFKQAAMFVGVDVLASWTRLAEQMYPILQAACRTPDVLELRSAAIDLIFYAIPAELVSSLKFSGLVYVLDGLEHLARCYPHRVTRPAGDLGPLLQAVTADPRTHLIVAWPSTLAPQTMYLPGLMAHVSTIGLVTRAALNARQFPQVLRCREKEYPLEVFLGCPGYLSILSAIAKPFRKTLTLPTMALSAHYQQNYEKSGAGAAEGYALRLDTPAAARVLEELLQFVQTLLVR